MLLFFVLINTVIPLMTLLIGVLFYYKPPQKINYIYGYRSSMSMKTQETWEYAHQFCGKLWIAVGIFMLVVTGLFLLTSFSGKHAKPDDRMGFIVLVQVFLMVGSLIPVEISLRNNFDNEGNRK